MPWVRLDDNVMDHPKFIALSANAFRLWAEGMTYCQKHLTDGLIPRSALKGLRYYSPASLKLLTAQMVPGKGPLWHNQQDGSVVVHDYMDYNDCRADVLKKRDDAKARMGRRRSREHPTEHPPEQSANGSCGVVFKSSGSEIKEGGVGETQPPTLTQRGGSFARWYADKHAELFDVVYIGNPVKDYESALRLCAVFSDDDLRDAALVWFGMRDKFATTGTRTITKFASRASECVQLARQVPA
jgi:hypothetical protein